MRLLVQAASYACLDCIGAEHQQCTGKAFPSVCNYSFWCPSCALEVNLNVKLVIPDINDNDEACHRRLCSALAEEEWTFHKD